LISWAVIFTLPHKQLAFELNTLIFPLFLAQEVDGISPSSITRFVA